jgi:hypothetical protein
MYDGAMKYATFLPRRTKPIAMPKSVPHLEVIEHLIEVIGETEDAGDLRLLMHTLRFVRKHQEMGESKAA